MNKKWTPPKEINDHHKQLMTAIGKQMQKMRIEKGLGIEKMGKEIGISRNTYSAMENGNIYFNISNLIRFCDYFGITVSDFFKRL